MTAMSTRHQPQQSVSSPAAESAALCQPLSPCITPPNTHCSCTELQTQAVGSHPVLGTWALLPVPSSAHASLQQLRTWRLLPPGAEEPRPRRLCWLLLGEESQIAPQRFSWWKPALGAHHPQGSSRNLPHLLSRAVFLPQDTPHHPMRFWLPDLLLLCQSFCILS